MRYSILLTGILYLMINPYKTPLDSAGRRIRQTDTQIPVLCYHNLRQKADKNNLLFIGKSQFDQQMKCLFENGYHSISPDQLLRHITIGDTLPLKPIILSFDDAHEEHYSIAKPILEKYGFKGVFFIITVCIGKRHYLTSAQIKELSDSGHTIGAHTWDHPNLTTLNDENWKLQIDTPKLQLEKITGKAVESFAYPYGVWNERVIVELKKRGIKIAFQLTDKRSSQELLMTVRRMMVSGAWSVSEFKNKIADTFNQ